MAAAAEEALAGTSALPQIGSPTKKTLRIELDGDSAPERTAGDTDRMRNKRGSIGVTKLNESKAKRAAAAQAHQQQAMAATPKPASRAQVEKQFRDMLLADLPGQAPIDLGPGHRQQLVPHPPTSPAARSSTSERPKVRVQSANQASRAFLQSVLSSNKSSSYGAQVPIWKEDLVERVRRRAKDNATSMQADGTRPGSSGVSSRGGPALAQTARPSTSAPRHPGSARPPTADRHKVGVTGGAQTARTPMPPSAHDVVGGSSMSNTARSSTSAATRDLSENGRLETRIAEKQRALFHYRDALGAEQLINQFQEADVAEVLAQCSRLQNKLESAAGRKGVLSLRGSAPMSAAIGAEARHSQNTQVAETRVSEAMHMNKQLEMCITELRLERKGVLGKKRRADEQEKLMTGEMRGFGATAHAALDEKEKVKGKERRMRHEWDIESTLHAATMTKLHDEDEWLETSIAHLDGREEEAQQIAKGEDYVEARARRSAAERRASRLGYLASQCLGMQVELAL